MTTPFSWIEISLTVSPQLCETCSSIIFEETGQGSFTEEGPEEGQGPSRLKAYLPKDESFRNNLVKLKNRIASCYIIISRIFLPRPGIFARYLKRTGKKTGSIFLNPCG